MPRSIVRTCTDEWAPFAMIFGVLMEQGGRMLNLKDVSGSPLQMNSSKEQGTCRTWVAWDQFTEDADLSPRQERNHTHHKGIHPPRIRPVSDSFAQRLRASDYLFARKFGIDSITFDQFQRLILS
mmetsp:Transcript_24432/g.56784  ORF Transcript_24432/g.56784 Transcript_24432/m.56784 type:complete len:125 (+) Transcript_24432:207-581(+)